MVAIRWPRWPLCPYMVKAFKNFLLQNRGCLGAESLQESSRTGGLPKLLKELSYIDIWPFYGKVKFASICMSPIHLYGKIVENFKKTSPLKPLSQFCLNFIWRHLRVGKRKIAKIVTVYWPRWPQCPYMLKMFKNLLLQNRECLGAESLHKSLGTRVLPKLLKELSYVWPFYGMVKFASLCICMSPIYLNRKIVENFKGLPLWSHWAKFAEISYWAFLGRWNERLLKWLQFIDQNGHHAHIW